MVDVFREVWRVLRDDGTLWLNIADSYSGSGKGPTGKNGVGQHERRQGFDTDCQPAGIPAKNLMLIPWRLVLALQADGWNVRSVIAWTKKAPMPESVTDRPSSAWEPIFLLTKRTTYFYDAEAVREPVAESTIGRGPVDFGGSKGHTYKADMGPDDPNYRNGSEQWGRTFDYTQSSANGRNQRNVWNLSPEPFSEAHFATFPTEIPRRAILAGTSAKGVCPQCGAPWRRVTDKRLIIQSGLRPEGRTKGLDASNGWADYPRGKNEVETTGWQPSCRCNAGEPIPATVLDPFGGAGTTALAANRNGRHAILCELSPAYADMARRRLVNDLGMLADVTVMDGQEAA
jgi:DNA modification methylase